MSVRVARIGKPHGVRGEVTVELFTDDPQARFAPGSVLSIQHARGGRRGQGSAADAREPLAVQSLTVTGHRWNKDVLVARFEEISDRNAAEAARGLELFAEVADLPLEDDEWHQDDLLGLVAVDLTRGEARIGTVKALIQGSAQDLLEITPQGGGRTVLVPFVEEIVPEVDLDRGLVLVSPPPGLLELGEGE
ncbi:ribosome maturation factor RimM [Kocuria rhizophila]|uniref:Ribosome maturation factor RimM n=1 Tax=Kocuria rhizophila (strain ATCC 9341 / DSM 348 / NBRC 103217 / DC2201) TaxID=378753 RepID=RIMM_KOCRD|nr:ribosome maturation factor RimM [Kocuria rhizophila]B2GFY3.1 RecName: Full=Ribosome maturation factor RimM [Kocuria rhizophila DC2201]ASE10679.1 ribosome maturation factor RimM [Kocuria rhizophila]BAG29411.1 putative 16S rRNA processing protein RimM [Kocuria rhizophila DC2201]VEH75309.1 Ribosome maturation factor rimM [Kocuria rhizophila]